MAAADVGDNAGLTCLAIEYAGQSMYNSLSTSCRPIESYEHESPHKFTPLSRKSFSLPVAVTTVYGMLTKIL